MRCHVFDHGSVGFDRGDIEEAFFSLFPDSPACVVDALHHHPQLLPGETSTEVTSGCGIGDASRSDGIEIGFIIAAMLDVIDTGSPGEQVQRDVEDMVRFVVGTMHLEDVGGTIDRTAKSDGIDQLHNGSDAATGDGLLSLSKFKLGARWPNHRRLPRAVFDG